MSSADIQEMQNCGHCCQCSVYIQVLASGPAAADHQSTTVDTEAESSATESVCLRPRKFWEQGGCRKYRLGCH